MNDLSQFLIESILGEADGVDNKVVVYSGRFQPFHKGHYATYSHLVKKFGKDNVYVGTSNKTDNNKSPFNFKEKVMVMTTMFGIPSNKIVEVKNPYVPTEVLKKFDKDTTAFITVVGKKDASRLGGKFFTPYKDNLDFEGYEDMGYVYIAPEQSNAISGTDVRMGLRRGSDEDKKQFFTKRAYPKYNDKIFKLISDKLSKLPEVTEETIFIPKHLIEEWLVDNLDLIVEASQILGKPEVDDGPNFLFPTYSVFDKVSQKRAEQIGYTVLSQIMSDELTDIDPHPIYPKGPVKAVTPFPAGVIGKTTASNQKDFYGSEAYTKWWRHVTRVAGLVGYSLVKSLSDKIDKEQAKKTKKITGLKLPTIIEAITLPVEVGDTILTGRFKNKKVVVKTIGKDEHGMPTINGKKVVTFRLVKEGKQVFFEDEKEDGKYTHIGYGKYKEKGKEKDSNSPTFQKDDSGKYIELEKGGGTQSAEKPQGQSLTKGSAGDSYKKQLPDNDPAKQQSTQEEDNWEKIDNKNNYYKSVRKYSDKELENETGEYFENETTQKTAPNAFKDKVDMIQKMKDSKPVYLSSEEMENMNNTDMGGILNSDNPKQTAKDLADEYGKDISWQYKSIENNEKVPAPIALRDKNGDYHLLAGNTRAMAFTAAGKKLPIKVIDYVGEFQYQQDESTINEIPMADLVKIDTYADKQLNPVDVVLTDKHFFDRLTDPRNKKEITPAELIGFFKRLAKKKKEFLNFLNLYGQIVAKDNRSKINIPFMQQANKVIAKTIMRKDDFKTSSPEYKFEDVIPGGLAGGMGLTDIAKHHNVSVDVLVDEFKKGISVEMEHTTDREVAKEIALDHLYEDPKYYTKLADIEEYVMYRTHIQYPANNSGLGSEELEEGFTKGELFAGNLKISGNKVPVEVQLIGANQKTKSFIVKIIHIDKKYYSKLPSDGIIEIPSRIFRLPGGGWYKIKTKGAFEGIGHGYPDQKWIDDHNKELKRLRTKFDKEQK